MCQITMKGSGNYLQDRMDREVDVPYRYNEDDFCPDCGSPKNRCVCDDEYEMRRENA